VQQRLHELLLRVHWLLSLQQQLQRDFQSCSEFWSWRHSD